jgi:hypothetical protein
LEERSCWLEEGGKTAAADGDPVREISRHSKRRGFEEAAGAWIAHFLRSETTCVGISGPGLGNIPPQQTSSRGEPGTGCNKCGINSDRLWEPGGKVDIQRKDSYGIHQKGNICEE